MKRNKTPLILVGMTTLLTLAGHSLAGSAAETRRTTSIKDFPDASFTMLPMSFSQCSGAAGWQLPKDEGSRPEAPNRVFGAQTQERAT